VALKAVDAFLDGLVDYAGLFPPASEDMRPALESYASHLESSDRKALGRFIVPLRRLKEFEDAGEGILPLGSDSEPWRLGVLVADDVHAAGEEMLKFNCHHWSGSPGGHAVIDVAELKASTVAEIESQRAELPRFFTPYFEIPVKGDVSPTRRSARADGLSGEDSNGRSDALKRSHRRKRSSTSSRRAGGKGCLSRLRQDCITRFAAATDSLTSPTARLEKCMGS